MNRLPRIFWQPALCLAVALLALNAPLRAFAYDPLQVSKSARPAWIDRTVEDTARQRTFPVRVYLPPGTSPAPVVLFSHGLGGSREGSAYLGEQWSARGYVCVFLQHPGSDAGVWQGKPPAQRMADLKEAANVRNFLARVKDVGAVLDQLARWNTDNGQVLSGRMDLSHVGMAGHSFGAATSQAVGGQTFAKAGHAFTDPRIKAAVILSPSAPQAGGDPKEAFGSVSIPWMLMTGTRDTALIGPAEAKSRLAVFPALPPGGKYELVLDRAEHSAFTDRALPGDREIRNPNHHRVILALSTAFWDAWLRHDQAAKAWLEGTGPGSLLERGDTWQKK